MRSGTRSIAFTIAVLTTLAGCGSDDSERHPDATAVSDASSSSRDFGGCTQYGVFTPDATQVYETDNPSPSIDWSEQLVGERATSDTVFDTLQYTYSHAAGTTEPTLPRQVTLAATTLSTCNDCVYLTVGVDSTKPDSTGTLYLAQSGEVTVHSADHGELSGSADVSGSAITLYAWSMSADQPAASGNCVTILSFDLQGTYDNGSLSDGGVDL